MTDTALTTRNGALWVQPNGPNTEVHFLGCHDLGDISEPSGSIDLLRCMDRKGGWKTVGSTQAPPDKISTSIENMTFMTRDWLEQITCAFTLYALQRAGGEPDIFTNYGRLIALQNARITSRSNKGIVHHLDETSSTSSVNIEAWPPAIRTGALIARKQIVSTVEALNDVYSYSVADCIARSNPGDKVIAGAVGTLYNSDIDQTLDGGVTWAPLATHPFTTSDVMSVVAFPISDTVTRLLVAKKATNGDQGSIAYSDDNGTTWVTVTIGGATAGHGAVDSGALFVIDQMHIWLASAKGYIYASEDGGITWSAQLGGSLTVKDVHCIAFYDTDNGMAGCADDILLKTSDGGSTWELTDAVTGTGDDIYAISPSGEFWWVGTETGHLFYSKDTGDTWTERSFSGSGTGSLDDVSFANELIGYAIHNLNSVGEIMVTVNGGYSWKAITTPSNAGLNALSVADENTVYAVGAPSGGTAVIIKVTWG